MDVGESGAKELEASWLRLPGRDEPSLHTIVSGVLLRLCVLLLLLHPLQRCVLEIQRSLSGGGGLSRSSFWVVGENWWLLWRHLLGCSCWSVAWFWSECVLVLELRFRLSLVQAGSRFCGEPTAMTTSTELLEREKMGAWSSSSSKTLASPVEVRVRPTEQQTDW